MSSSDEAGFGEAWDRDGPRVAAYVRRHVPADDVQDVVAETFLQAWRRWDAVPRPPIAWLIGTARKVVGNSRRAGRRRAALHDRLVLLGAAARSSEDAGMLATERMSALEALASLPDQQRVATSSSGTVCFALSDGQWDGEGSPTEDQLSYGCGGQIYAGPGRPPQELTRPDQLGGFFKDDAGPLVYGISAYPDAVSVRVQGAGVDRTLPVRSDSHGYGAALPEAAQAAAVTLTFVDAEGRVLGSTRSVAPVG